MGSTLVITSNPKSYNLLLPTLEMATSEIVRGQVTDPNYSVRSTGPVQWSGQPTESAP